jgi:hypothetical protein
LEILLKFGVLDLHPFTWLIHRLRNWLRASLFYPMIAHRLKWSSPTKVHVVSATRMSEAEFWKKAALGRSLKQWLGADVTASIAFQNKEGLPLVYNRALEQEFAEPVAIVFVHDDIWLDDGQWLAKLRLALRRFDIVGVAGTRRRHARQPAWLFSERKKSGEFVWDRDWLSGGIGHGPLPFGKRSSYGPAPAVCVLLDGAFVAVHSLWAQKTQLRFDSRFDFHFYDLDLCRSAARRGLRMGTWPIDLTHQSGGAFGSQDWDRGYSRYKAKWKL